MNSNYAIIVAGGLGSRMKNDLPKQFLKINEKEIILYSIEKFIQFDPSIRIIISTHKDYISHLQDILNKRNFSNVRIIEGGKTRFASVKNGLALIADHNAIVGIHDAARPLVSLQTITNCYQTALEKGNAIPVIPLSESIRQKTNGENKNVNRNDFFIVQTPQCFLVSKILKAFGQPYSDLFTDDASVLETTGEKIVLVEGNAENIKITHQKDLIIAKALLEHEQ